MNLSALIRTLADDIIARCVEFARTLEPLSDPKLDVRILRDDFQGILDAIATDLEQLQTRAQAIAKSEGLAPATPVETSAQKHGRARAESGLSITQTVAEYRVLRSVILQMWVDSHVDGGEDAYDDIIRFNGGY